MWKHQILWPIGEHTPGSEHLVRAVYRVMRPATIIEPMITEDPSQHSIVTEMRERTDTGEMRDVAVMTAEIVALEMIAEIDKTGATEMTAGKDVIGALEMTAATDTTGVHKMIAVTDTTETERNEINETGGMMIHPSTAAPNQTITMTSQSDATPTIVMTTHLVADDLRTSRRKNHRSMRNHQQNLQRRADASIYMEAEGKKQEMLLRSIVQVHNLRNKLTLANSSVCA